MHVPHMHDDTYTHRLCPCLSTVLQTHTLECVVGMNMKQFPYLLIETAQRSHVAAGFIDHHQQFWGAFGVGFQMKKKQAFFKSDKAEHNS